jgi:3-hydroxyacyl-CoA dehydrogenase
LERVPITSYISSDVDVVYRNGYEFPAERGGPMFYADHLELSHVRMITCVFSEICEDLLEIMRVVNREEPI